MGESEGLGLSEFLADLRLELQEAQQRALTADAGVGPQLRLGVEQVTVTVEVAHERTVSGEVAGKASGRFWVFGSVEASGKAGGLKKRAGTQTLTLTLTPRVDTAVTDEQGGSSVQSAGLDVSGAVGAGEQQPPPAVAGLQ